MIMDSKEWWMYVTVYKPLDIKTSMFVDIFSWMHDLILKVYNNIIVLRIYNCNFMSENELYDMHFITIPNFVSTPTYYKSHLDT